MSSNGLATRDVEDDVRGAGEDRGAGAARVVGGEEVAADGRAEGEQGTGLDFFGVGAEGGDRVSRQLNALVVHAAQAVGDGVVAAGPFADGQVDGEQAVAGEGELPRPSGPCRARRRPPARPGR